MKQLHSESQRLVRGAFDFTDLISFLLLFTEYLKYLFIIIGGRCILRQEIIKATFSVH